MTELKWIKLSTDIFDNEKILFIEQMPESDSILIIWLRLLCLAGKQNNSGIIAFKNRPYTDEMLSIFFRKKKTIISMAMKIFIDFGMVESIDGFYKISNWGKYQSINSADNRKEYQRNWIQAKRNEQNLSTICRQSVDTYSVDTMSTNVDNHVDTMSTGVDKQNKNKIIEVDIDNIDINNLLTINNNISTKERETRAREKKIITAEVLNNFENFWEMYPRKVSKSDALKAWQNVKSADVPRIFENLPKAKASQNWLEDNGKFIPYPATWLNGRRWEDEYNSPVQKTYKELSACQKAEIELEALKRRKAANVQ